MEMGTAQSDNFPTRDSKPSMGMYFCSVTRVCK